MQRAPPWLAGGSALSWLCRGSECSAADTNSCVYIPLKGFLGTNNAWYGGRGRKTKPREEEGPSCEMVSDFTSLSAQIASSAFSTGPREKRVAFPPTPPLPFKIQHHGFSAGTKRVLWLSKNTFLHIKCSAGQMGSQALGQPSSVWPVLICSQITPDLLHFNYAPLIKMTRIKGNLLFPKQAAFIGVFFPAQLWGSGGVGALCMVNYFLMYARHRRLQGHPALPCMVLQTGIHPCSLQTQLLHADSCHGSGSPHPLYIHMPHLLQIPDLPPSSATSSTRISCTPETISHLLFSSFLLPPHVPDPQSLSFTPPLKSLPSHAHSPHSSSILSLDKTTPNLSQSHQTRDQTFDFLQSQIEGTRRGPL